MARDRTPNTRLREIIQAAGCSYETLARTVNTVGREAGARLSYRSPSVAQWLAGAHPRDPAPQFIAEALARKLRRPVTLADIGMAPPPHACTLPPGSVWADPADTLITLGTHIVERRTLLTGTYTVAAAWAIPGWQDAAARSSYAAALPGARIGMADVDAVRRMTAGFDEVGDLYGAAQVLHTAATYLAQVVTPYLRADATEDVRRALHQAAGVLTYLVGWWSWDSTLHAAAQRYYTTALRLAASANDRTGYATALRGMAIQASGLGHHNTAAHLADHAATTAGPSAEPGRTAFLRAAQALAAAGQRDQRTAYAHLTAAERDLERAGSATGPTSSFHTASCEYSAALVHLALGHGQDAANAMARSLHARPAGERRTRAVSAAILAQTQLGLGRLEEACATWTRMLDDVAHVRCGRLDQAVTEMRAALTPHSRHPAAAALLHQTRTAHLPA